MTTTTTTPDQIRKGDRIQANLGGQLITFTVCEIVKNHEGRTCVRSTLDSDHVWSHMWVHLSDAVVLADPFEGL